MIHTYKDELDETDIKLLANNFTEVKSPNLLLFSCINFEHLFALFYFIDLSIPLEIIKIELKWLMLP